MIDFEKFTNYSQEIIFAANAKKDFYKNSEVQPEHIVMAMIEDKGISKDYLTELKLLNQNFINAIVARIKEYPTISGVSGSQQVFLSRETNTLLEVATQEAETLKDDFIGIECILIAMTKLDNSFIKDLLKRNGVDTNSILNAMRKIRGNKKVDNKNAEENMKALEKYSTDLTERARKGKLDPVIGRDEEVRRIIQVLNRRTKNNPVLIGEPGVGKTAIVEGLAQRIIRGDVPESLKDVKLISLDLGALVAGAKFRAEFEERLKAVLKEVQESNGEIVMFIDELHTVVGAGATEGSMDAGNLLKPMLARGELRTIGATTINEYRKYIEKDPALARRFQPVQVDEPTVEDTISILRGLKDRYEVFHGVKIQDSALITAAVLSNRYISDRFLPDKAIDLVDEACALIRTEMNSMPTELDDIARKIMQKEIAETALKKEEDKLSKEQLEEVQKELSELRDEFNSMKTRWENEKNSISRLQKLREDIDKTNADIAEAERSYDLNKAAELKYGKLPALKKELEEAEDAADDYEKNTLLRDKVTDEEIAKIVGRWTGIPVSKLMEGEREKLLRLEDILHKRVIGQDEAVEKVSEAILRSRAGIQDPNRPLGSFMFMGPTGVGKTELAKALAQALFDDEKNIVRIDMTEYMEKHSVSRLIGAPPGYVGYEEGGQLTEAVRRKPYAVVLFDEVEKAHPDVFNILLQVLDDGRITDSQGRTVDFKNTIIILTSNLGSDYILDGIDENNEITPEARAQVDKLLKTHFRPEFLNRLDEIVFYKPLSKKEIYPIIDLMLEKLRQRLADKQLELEVTDSAKELIVKEGYDPVYGARPLKRYIQSKLETLIARTMIAEDLEPDTVIRVDSDGEKMLVTALPPKTE